ncbi:two-component system, OmpR family, alkaline phosphatase synthesis response regulator PhoP [Granulicatella balaenopterae]|uniref:Two-component system, OmpR family, alkaline phosphatase synthesis response regulator PhoP n=1 Tax=Granulicatella balaenopterae TaxID=137733 RepID=A0A1H9M2W5_9LACT|nr:response regulator transcription factor [Granulicatella balaenopterae]SER17433.1 two-component system, OmpR family, alkaline phosphatase synthesis response regulator PhoP [Granulicatella balaenopterae]
MKKVLIVDDEPSILLLLSYNLEKEGYVVQQAEDGLIAYQMALENQYDFIILDIMLPSMNGIDICQKLRLNHIETPILMLTARDDEFDKIIGLEIGADDYMTKPFSPREVLARMKAIFRRMDATNKPKISLQENEEILKVGELTIYVDRHEVYLANEPVELTPKQYELLLYMAKRLGKAHSREQLLHAVWDFDFSGETRIVDVHIGHLREKIEKDTKRPKYLKTVRGFGYKMEDPS